MGIFDTPAIVNENILALKNKNHTDFILDVIFVDDDNIFHIKHDYFDSPCYFKIALWKLNPKGIPVFLIEYYPESANNLIISKKEIIAGSSETFINGWQKTVARMLNYEVLYCDPKLESLRAEICEKLGLSEDNADQIIDEVQKKHAAQYCDQISDILDDLDSKDFDDAKIREIKFDIEKIKRDIESLKIKTKGDLADGITRVWSKIKLAKIGSYLLDKGADGIAGKFIGEIIDKIR